MKKTSVLIFGASGMLGSMLLDVLSQESTCKISATVRDKKQLKAMAIKYPNITFVLLDIRTISQDNLEKLVKKHKWVVNAIGAIKPTIPNDSPEVIENAVSSNILFPLRLARAIKVSDSRILQIATDCVFSENSSGATELYAHNATDVYGKTKSLGEINMDKFYILRCSVIGPEIFNNRSLLAWFLTQPKNVKISGFTNHIWNGITTLHFAQICKGIIKNNTELSHLQHIIPANNVTKAKLLKIFTKVFNRKDITILPIKAKTPVNRTLRTIHDTINKQLWRQAEYKTPPTIEEMVIELAEYMKTKNI